MVPALMQRILSRHRWTWHWLLNGNRTVRHVLFDRQPPAPNHDLEELRTTGILVRPAAQLLDAAALACLREAAEATQTKLAEPEPSAFRHGQGAKNRRKGYRLSLILPEETPHPAWLALAISPPLLALINGYLGMRSLLRAMGVWLDVPTAEPPTETQLWHRDDDDYSNLKVFIYLNEVASENGPFCFLPGTHPGGPRHVPRSLDRQERVTDAEMHAAIPAPLWRVCTAPAGTIILADTRGYHKGLQPTAGHRLLVMFHYTSGKPKHGRALVVSSGQDYLTAPQRFALAS
ncbi:hypothetical protein AYO44_15410 [Planctomycetaceae bacterium SCGC AG-212-F19]|nr:hypothetical protein AYO44_15410 [Planctomycetaceae bacterium SCGC AG-212-F19]